MDNPELRQEKDNNKGLLLDLVDLLEVNQEEIATAWAQLIQDKLGDSLYGQYPIKKISRNNLVGLLHIRDFLLGFDSFSFELGHGIPERLMEFVASGIPINEVVAGAWLFQDVIPAFLSQKNISRFPPKEVTQLLDYCTHRLVLDVVENYATEMNHQIQKEHQQTVLMLEMSRQAGSTLELDMIIKQASQGIAAASGAENCIIFLLGKDRISCELGGMTDNLPSPLVEFFHQPSHKSFPLALTPALKQIVEKQEVLNLYNSEADDLATRLTNKRWGVRALLVIPVILIGRVLAIAVAFNLNKDHVFTDQQIELGSGLASIIAPAIENARLYAEVEKIAMLEERARLAQEIHDDLAQSIYAIQFRIFLASDSLTTGEITQAKVRVDEVQNMLNQVNGSVRELIFNLRAVSTIDKSFLTTLEDYLESYRQNYGLDIQLETDEEAINSLNGIVGVHTTRIIQETLSNAHRHGHASRVCISITRKNQGVCVCVEDNGIGFDISQIEGPDQQHYGIATMWERAKKISGDFSLESEPGHGARIMLYLPDRED
jgi:signal transduction histidine kinase